MSKNDYGEVLHFIELQKYFKNHLFKKKTSPSCWTEILKWQRVLFVSSINKHGEGKKKKTVKEDEADLTFWCGIVKS